MGQVVKAKVLRDKNTVALARNLLGKLLVRQQGDGVVNRRRICEVEAYDGESDLACHASKGRTRRTEVMYAPGGVWYVYLCYGIHEMLNLVTGPQDYPAAILIRGVEGLVGPGRLTKALAIDRRMNGVLAAPLTGLWIEDDGFAPRPADVEVSPRIGIDYAGPQWASKLWRFTYRPQAASTSSTLIAERSVARRTTRT